MAISPDVVERARARVGMVLGSKYRLDRLLGIGGMAAVYAATHRNKKRVAVKILHPELSIDDTVKTRFLREGYAANTVDHPGAVQVFDDDVTTDGSAFLVMELLVGETLDARADRKGGTLPLAEVLPLADQLLDVLAAAHEKGLLHRDIKPDNLFLTANGQLKVLDFGIARLRELSADGNATGVGSFMGTPAFMSPEQARGRWDDVDSRSDVWAVGATIFNLLSGRAVHETDSIGEQLVMAATVPAPPLISILPEIDPVVADVVDRALAFDKARRWPDVASMQVALKHAISILAPTGNLVVPKTSLPLVDVDREAATLAIGDSQVGFDSRPSAPARDSLGGSIPSPLTSRTGNNVLEPPWRYRGFILIGVAAAAAIATVFLWPRAPSTIESVPAAQVAPYQEPVAPEPPAAETKPESPTITLAPAPAAEADANLGVAKSRLPKKPPVAAIRPKGGGPVRPQVSAVPADAVKSTSPPATAAAPPKKVDPLSKRY
jgi:eukaryotic-like serine/threonine-protein kinase